MLFFLSILIAFSLEIGVKCGRAVFFSAHLFQSVPLSQVFAFHGADEETLLSLPQCV